MFHLTRGLCLAILFAGLALLGPGASAYAAGPAPDTRIWLPIQAPASVTITQGNFGSLDHTSANGSQYAFDFAVGSSAFVVTAAQAGTIVGYSDSSNIQCDDLDHQYGDPKGVLYSSKSTNVTHQKCWTMANYVLIVGDDGKSASLYLHLEQGSVQPYVSGYLDGHVVAGDPIGVADTSGYALGNPHLHFQVETVPSDQWRTNHPYSWWWTQSIPVTFSNPEVLDYEVQNPDWMTTWCGKTCPGFALNQVPPRPTPTPPPIGPSGPGTVSCTTGPTGLIGAGLLVLFVNRYTRRRRGARTSDTPPQEHERSGPPTTGTPEG